MNKVDMQSVLKAPFAKRYGNFIGGEWREPRSGKYFENISPVTGLPVCEIPRSDASDIEAAQQVDRCARVLRGHGLPPVSGPLLFRERNK